MSVYFSSDFHLGHKVITDKYRTMFPDRDSHDNHILDKVAELTKKDMLLVLGDMIFDSDDYERYIGELSKMPCRIKLLMGNHDSLKLYRQDVIEIQAPLFSYKNMWLSHCPIHPQEIRNRLGNVHGHLHFAELDDARYFDVGLDKNNYEFVHLDTIKDYFRKI